MCTILILNHVHPSHPVVIAANREELYARPWAPPEELAPGIIGGRDLEKGGTWLGATRQGFFAAVTNQPSMSLDRTRHSRGELVLNVLSAGTKAAAHLATLRPADYNPFNLIFGDAAALHVAYGRPDAAEVAVAPVGDGIHVLANDILDGPHPRVARARELAPPMLALTEWPELVGGLRGILSHPEICLHSPTYGTCSASILTLAEGHTTHYLFAPGPPCTTPFEPVTALP